MSLSGSPDFDGLFPCCIVGSLCCDDLVNLGFSFRFRVPLRATAHIFHPVMIRTTFDGFNWKMILSGVPPAVRPMS